MLSCALQVYSEACRHIFPQHPYDIKKRPLYLKGNVHSVLKAGPHTEEGTNSAAQYACQSGYHYQEILA